MKSIPKSADVQVGLRLRLRRRELRLSQKTVARVLHVSYQQVRKYEKGICRIAASRLAILSDLLKATPAYFFEYGFCGTATAESGIETTPPTYASFHEIERLTRAFCRIANPALRAAIIAFIDAIETRPAYGHS